MKRIVLFELALCFGSSFQYTDSPLKQKYDGYADEWIFMPDGDDKPQVAVLKGEGPQFRGLLDESVTYHLYTRSNPEKPILLYTGNPDSIKKSNFNPSHPTKFITHGWKSSAIASGPSKLKNGEEYSTQLYFPNVVARLNDRTFTRIFGLAFLEKGDHNVILVDWEPLASSTFYLGPMQNTGKVGLEASKFIDYLIEQTGQSPDDIHFIGHSLGAHVAANAASSVKSGKIGRLTGLDPALPGFHVLETNEGRLDKSDAQFVDVIHSCGGILGYLQPLGHADFYPNAGAAVQPGCCCMEEFLEACSHGRAYAYYTESINSKHGFLATKCDSWDQYEAGYCDNAPVVFLGDPVDHSAAGTYWLKTNSESPYARKARSLISAYDQNKSSGTKSLIDKIRNPAKKVLEFAEKIGFNLI